MQQIPKNEEIIDEDDIIAVDDSKVVDTQEPDPAKLARTQETLETENVTESSPEAQGQNQGAPVEEDQETAHQDQPAHEEGEAQAQGHSHENAEGHGQTEGHDHAHHHEEMAEGTPEGNQAQGRPIQQVRVGEAPDLLFPSIKFIVMGSEECPIDPEDEELSFFNMRIGEIQALDQCVKCKVIQLAFPNSSYSLVLNFLRN